MSTSSFGTRRVEAVSRRPHRHAGDVAHPFQLWVSVDQQGRFVELQVSPAGRAPVAVAHPLVRDLAPLLVDIPASGDGVRERVRFHDASGEAVQAHEGSRQAVVPAHSRSDHEALVDRVRS